MQGKSLTLTISPLLATLPGLRHGFTNLKVPPHEREELENSTATFQQVHKADLLWVNSFEKRARQADAIATFSPGLPIGVFSADCTPILVTAFSEDQQKVFAIMAIHAGWRGTALGITQKSLEAFFQACKPRDASLKLKATIGPCISFSRFEVGPEVVAAFPNAEQSHLAKFLRLEGEQRKFLFDLAGENLRQLRAIQEAWAFPLEVEHLNLCTVSEPSLLPSYRRERERAGRILSFLEILS